MFHFFAYQFGITDTVRHSQVLFSTLKERMVSWHIIGRSTWPTERPAALLGIALSPRLTVLSQPPQLLHT